MIKYFIVLLSLTSFAFAQFSATPIGDLGTGYYKKFYQGGLYPNGSNVAPSQYNAAGLSAGAAVHPMNPDGRSCTSGPTCYIVMVGAGMSIAVGEFDAFSRNPAAINSQLLLHNGAIGGQDLPCWINAYGPPSDSACALGQQNPWDKIVNDLVKGGLSNLQVQVLWFEDANSRLATNGQYSNSMCAPINCVPLDANNAGNNTATRTDALSYEQALGEVARAAKIRFPNLKQLFLSGRPYAGWAAAAGISPEPYAYEQGFGVKWLIGAQINRLAGGKTDSIAGDLSLSVAPWIGWAGWCGASTTTRCGYATGQAIPIAQGSWGNGPNRRSDGLFWCDNSDTPQAPCNGKYDDMDSSDGPHLSSNPQSGYNMVGQMLTNFFLHSNYTPWFP